MTILISFNRIHLYYIFLDLFQDFFYKKILIKKIMVIIQVFIYHRNFRTNIFFKDYI